MLSAIELPLTERTGSATGAAQEDLEKALASSVYEPLDTAIRTTLQSVSLCTIIEEEDRRKSEDNIMYFI